MPQPGQRIILPDGGGFKVSVVSEENPDDVRHRRWQQTGIIFAALAMFTVTFFVTQWVGFFAAGADAELKKAAIGIFITLAGALGGFLGGRATK
jgi:mannose/cellobiose epimerase-like protein (N-acyl-D-glucosamine 2-epimerase family)